MHADSIYNLRSPLTVCGFRIQLGIPRQLEFFEHIFHYLFVESTNCSDIRNFCCRFTNFVADSAKMSVLEQF